MFTLRAAVMWTVNDFPAYAMVSGWSTKGYMACPVCKEDVTSGWHAGKVCYLGHRRWLPWDHEWREKDKEFDGNTERRLRPREWSSDKILEQLNHLDFAPFGKTKNVFDTLVGTILDIEGKTKDTIKARLDLERIGVRRGLWMNRDSDKARRDLAFFSMKPNGKKEFLKFVSSIKFPDGYASNIARCLRHDIVQVLCKFEMIFPPAFFTSMMHVMVHLPEEALLAGPVNYRWMYPIERLLGELKKSVRNRAKLEGSIIEAWVQYESLTFCGINDPCLRLPHLSPPSPLPSLSVRTSATSLPSPQPPPCRRVFVDFSRFFAGDFSLLRPPFPTPEMSDLIRRGRSMTTAPSSDPPAQSASAATAPALLDHVVVGPGPSQAPASSASSVAQPASARRRHRPTDTINTTSTDDTGASGSQPGKCLMFLNQRHVKIVGCTDSDWAGKEDKRRSKSGYFTFIRGNLVTFRSKKQKVVSSSSVKAQYQAMVKGVCELLWLKRLMGELSIPTENTMKLYCDNQSTIKIVDNPVQHDRTKHVELIGTLFMRN
ncbi:hypothetical protein L3X38_018214 [Prunus dulcis]|uniref:DUF4218 domain-containing protein n=1 Tax=Prunus dulcis TaxID=3755 RepID=A0AAD4WBC4_PRUDU|nr:hypothetical protein L3X38_018214 [Prunus dulcis]